MVAEILVGALFITVTFALFDWMSGTRKARKWDMSALDRRSDGISKGEICPRCKGYGSTDDYVGGWHHDYAVEHKCNPCKGTGFGPALLPAHLGKKASKK